MKKVFVLCSAVELYLFHVFNFITVIQKIEANRNRRSVFMYWFHGSKVAHNSGTKLIDRML